MSVFSYTPACSYVPHSRIFFEVLKDGVDMPHISLVDKAVDLQQDVLELHRRVIQYNQQAEYVNRQHGGLNSLEQLVSLYSDEGVSEAELHKYTTVSSLPYITLGRVPTCHVVVEHSSQSRVHAVLEFGPNGEFFITDKSTHGIKLNKGVVTKGEKVRQYHGDTLRFGDSSRMHIVNYADEVSRGDVEDKATMEGYVQQSLRAELARKEKLKVDKVVISDEDEEQALFDAWVAWDGVEEPEGAEHERLASGTSFLSALLFIGKSQRQKDQCASFSQAKDRFTAVEDALMSSGGGMARNTSQDKLRANFEKTEKHLSMAEQAVKGSFRAKLDIPNAESFAWGKGNDVEDDVADATFKYKQSNALGFYALVKRTRDDEQAPAKRAKKDLLSELNIDLGDKQQVAEEIARLEAELEFHVSVLESHLKTDELTAALDAATKRRGGSSLKEEAEEDVATSKEILRQLQIHAMNLGM